MLQNFLIMYKGKLFILSAWMSNMWRVLQILGLPRTDFLMSVCKDPKSCTVIKYFELHSKQCLLGCFLRNYFWSTYTSSTITSQGHEGTSPKNNWRHPTLHDTDSLFYNSHLTSFRTLCGRRHFSGWRVGSGRVETRVTLAQLRSG